MCHLLKLYICPRISWPPSFSFSSPNSTKTSLHFSSLLAFSKPPIWLSSTLISTFLAWAPPWYYMPADFLPAQLLLLAHLQYPIIIDDIQFSSWSPPYPSSPIAHDPQILKLLPTPTFSIPIVHLAQLSVLPDHHYFPPFIFSAQFVNASSNFFTFTCIGSIYLHCLLPTPAYGCQQKTRHQHVIAYSLPP